MGAVLENRKESTKWGKKVLPSEVWKTTAWYYHINCIDHSLFHYRRFSTCGKQSLDVLYLNHWRSGKNKWEEGKRNFPRVRILWKFLSNYTCVRARKFDISLRGARGALPLTRLKGGIFFNGFNESPDENRSTLVVALLQPTAGILL